MADRSLFDSSKLQDLDKQKQAQNEQLHILLEQNNLIRKKMPDGPNSLLRSISDAIYFTAQYADELQQFLFKHLAQVIANDKLPQKLQMFRGNSMLLKDYTSNPHLSGFDKINLELASSQLKVKIIVYSVTDDDYLSSIIVNNGYERTIEIVRNKNNQYEPVYSKSQMLKLGVAQNIVLNIVDQALDGKAGKAFKDINEDSYINYNYLHWLSSTHSENSLNQFRITRGKHKKSFSDTFSKVFEAKEEQPMKFYNMFTNTKPPEDFLKLIKQRKDTMDSVNANFDFMDEPWHETPSKPTEDSNKVFSTPGAQTSSNQAPEGLFPRPLPSKTPTATAQPAFFQDTIIEKVERVPPRDTNISPVHFLHSPPPGLTPSRYQQKSFTYEVVNPENMNSSPTFQRSESNQTPNNIYGQTTPTRQGYGTFSQAYQPSSPQPPQGINNLYTKRTGNLDTLTIPVQASEGIQPGLYDPGALSASKEKKKPIILDESKERYTGRLKFFDEAKNYGFIVMDGDGSDIFVHMDDLMKANITKDMLRMTKNGFMLRLAFSCMMYIGKYQKSRKAVEIELLPQ